MSELGKGKELSLDELENVSGGFKANVSSLNNITEKYNELEKAWDTLGFEKQGATRHQLDALCDEWEMQGYKPSAMEFLSGKKWW